MALRIAMRNPHEFAGVVSIDSALPQSESTPFRNWQPCVTAYSRNLRGLESCHCAQIK